MPTSDNHIPVLLFGSGLTVLGAMRSFGRAGIPVYCVASDNKILAGSKWFQEPPSPSPQRSDLASLEPFLLSLPWARCVLMPCTDIWIKPIAEVSSRYPERFLCCQPATDTVDLFLDKGKFADLVDRLNIPHPMTFTIESAQQLADLQLADFSGSFLKPRDSYRFHRHYRVKACHVHSREDAIAQFEKKRSAGFAMMFQEYIKGDASHHFFLDGFVDREGAVRAILARQRLRMYPTDFGNSTYMVSIKPARVQQAIDDLTRLLSETRYRGIFSAEFKLDDRDRLLKILEVNARPWWFVEFTARCGIDVCLMAYRDALGDPVPSQNSYCVGARFVHAAFDLECCRLLMKNDRITLGECASSWLGANFPIFCWDDPYPSIQILAQKAVRRIKRWFLRRSS